MNEAVSNEIVSVLKETRPLKARDIRRAKWASII